MIELERENKREGEEQPMSHHHLERLENSPPAHHLPKQKIRAHTHNYTEYVFIYNSSISKQQLIQRKRSWKLNGKRENNLSDNNVNCWGGLWIFRRMSLLLFPFILREMSLLLLVSLVWVDWGWMKTPICPLSFEERGLIWGYSCNLKGVVGFWVGSCVLACVLH